MNAVGYPLYINGKLVPGVSRIVHAPTAAGSYYIGPPPVGEYTINPNAPLGAYVKYPVRGLGQAGAALAGIGLVGAVLYIGIVGGAGWFAGKAMAPNRQSEGGYKWAGAISNIVAPGVGLGVVGIVSLAAQGGQRSVMG